MATQTESGPWMVGGGLSEGTYSFFSSGWTFSRGAVQTSFSYTT